MVAFQSSEGLFSDLRITLSDDLARLDDFSRIADAVSTLVTAASWPSFCLDDQPEVWEQRRRLAHGLEHTLADLTRSPRRYRTVPLWGQYRQAMRVAVILDALWPEESSRLQRLTDDPRSDPRIPPPLELGEDLYPPFDEIEAFGLFPEPWFRDRGTGELSMLAPSDSAFARFYRTRVSSMTPVRADLVILDLGRSSPPFLRVGLSTSVVITGGAAAFTLSPLVGVPVVLVGLLNAVLALRANRAYVRTREAEADEAEARARANVAKEELREQIYLATRAELERSPQLVELVVETALPAVLALGDDRLDRLDIGLRDDPGPGASELSD